MYKADIYYDTVHLQIARENTQKESDVKLSETRTHGEDRRKVWLKNSMRS